jgi:hypothetical protein
VDFLRIAVDIPMPGGRDALRKQGGWRVHILDLQIPLVILRHGPIR